MIARPLLERILHRIELDVPRAHDLESLTRTYAAWCAHVPFDNLQKRVFHTTEGGELPGGDPREVFERYLQDGTGGTCWAGSGALHALLVSLGFDARRAVGSMIAGGMEPSQIPTRGGHGTVFVRVGDATYLCDTFILSGAPLRLVEGERTSLEGALGARAEPYDGNEWRVWFEPWNGRPTMSCLVHGENADPAYYVERHQRSETTGPFNAQAYVRRRTPKGLSAIVLGARIDVDHAGNSQRIVFPDRGARDGALASLGYARSFLAGLPVDEPTAP